MNLVIDPRMKVCLSRKILGFQSVDDIFVEKSELLYNRNIQKYILHDWVTSMI